MLVTSEACTYGGIVYTMTGLTDSSGWFERGFMSSGLVQAKFRAGVLTGCISTTLGGKHSSCSLSANRFYR